MRGDNNSLEKLYNQIFDQIYPQIENQKCGVLYKAIHLILISKKQKAEVICKYSDVRDYNSFKDDYKIIDTVVKNPKEYITLQLPNVALNQEINQEKEMKKWIVVIACVLVGVYACIKFIEDTQKREGRRRANDDKRPPEQENFAPSKSITVALCLVVPAYVASKVKDQSPINAYEIEQLINKASYFLCTQFAEADYIQQYLEFTDENVVNIGEQREVYIRINIPNGQEMIGSTLRYILNRNLPSNAQGVVRQIACLNNLSGLEKFNRV